MSDLGIRISERIGEATVLKTQGIALENARKNQPYFGKTIDDLTDVKHPEPNKPAIVVCAGPSLRRRNSISRIKSAIQAGFNCDIIAVDSSLGHCLREGLVPGYVVTVDPDYYGYQMVRFLGDPELASRPKDDFFVRRDPEAEKDEVSRNQELIELVNRYGKDIKAIIGTSATPLVTRRCVESGMDLYWWNPIYDDYDEPDSISKKLFEENGIPCMVTGGKVGTAAWIFAHAVLKRKNIAMVGEDIGYAPGTLHYNTQFYRELVELLGEDRIAEAFIQIYNPHLNETWFVDPTFYWYRKIFLELSSEAECTTYNCTEGGTLFGEAIQFVPLDQFLSKFSVLSTQGGNNG